MNLSMRNRAAESTRSRRALIPVAVAMVAGLALAGCGSADDDTATAAAGASSGCTKPDGSPFTFAFVPGTTGDPFYITMKAGISEQAKKLGVKMEIQGAAEWNPTLQVPILASLLIKKPDALIFVPNDVKSLAPSAQKFVDAKIPIVTVDNTLESDALVKSRITSDNEQGGALAAERLAEITGEKGAVAIIDVSPGNSTTDARAKGFTEKIATYPNMKVVAHEYNQNSATKGAAQTRAALLAHPEIAGIFGTNLGSTEGAGNGVESSGKKVPVVGYDASPSEVKMLKSGVINSLVIQPPAQEGSTAVDTACAVLTGKSFESNIVLKNVLATSENAADPEVAKYFYVEN